MNDSNDLLVRINKLERQHRRLRASFAGVLVLLGVALVSGQAGPQAKPKAEPLRRVEAQEFVLVDAHGVEWGKWSVVPHGAGFYLVDKASRGKVSMVVSKAITGLTVKHGDLYGLLGSGEGTMRFTAGNKKTGRLVELRVNEDLAALDLLDKGKGRIHMKVGEGGPTPVIAIYGQSGEQRGVWGVDENQNVTFAVRTGKSVASLVAEADKATVLVHVDRIMTTLTCTPKDIDLMFSTDGRTRGLWHSAKDGMAAMWIFDKAGKLVFQAPSGTTLRDQLP